MLGETIKDYRIKQKLSQLELSLKVGWENPSTLSRIESGEVKPSRDTILKISTGLKLDQNQTNILLREGGYYLLEEDITAEYKNKIVNTILDDINKFNYPVCVMQQNSSQLCCNVCMQVVLYNSSNKKYNNKTHIDILFDEKYEIKNNILNWVNFSFVLVRAMYSIYKLNPNAISEDLGKWLQYPDFKTNWNLLTKSENPNNFDFYSNQLLYNHHELGILTFEINAFPLHSDYRFFMQQFIPVSVEDKNKIENYMKSLNK